jgi:hypothetical protein
MSPIHRVIDGHGIASSAASASSSVRQVDGSRFESQEVPYRQMLVISDDVASEGFVHQAATAIICRLAITALRHILLNPGALEPMLFGDRPIVIMVH